MNDDAVRLLSYHSENIRLDELITRFTHDVAGQYIAEGTVFADWSLKNPANHIVYTVQSGETLTKIAGSQEALTRSWKTASS